MFFRLFYHNLYSRCSVSAVRSHNYFDEWPAGQRRYTDGDDTRQGGHADELKLPRTFDEINSEQEEKNECSPETVLRLEGKKIKSARRVVYTMCIGGTISINRV
jgi:hypothetical protein